MHSVRYYKVGGAEGLELGPNVGGLWLTPGISTRVIRERHLLEHCEQTADSEQKLL